MCLLSSHFFEPGALFESDDRFCLATGMVNGDPNLTWSEFVSWTFASGREEEILGQVKMCHSVTQQDTECCWVY